MRRTSCLAVAVMVVGLLAGPAAAKGIDIEPADFVQGIDNPWMPLVPGTIFNYQAETEDGLELTETVVTYQTTTIQGVVCIVVHDTSWILPEDAEQALLVEETDDWFAQDVDGNVWYFGEDTLEYEYDDDWNPIGTSDEGSWTAGIDGAEAGIVMLANPMAGFSYRQEYYEGEAEDEAKVLKLHAPVSIELGDFDCLKIKEWTHLEPGSVEHKYYAFGRGLVYVEELCGGKTVQVELVDVCGP